MYVPVPGDYRGALKSAGEKEPLGLHTMNATCVSIQGEWNRENGLPNRILSLCNMNQIEITNQWMSTFVELASEENSG